MNEEYLVYFDTEFTGLRKDTSIISIGLIDSMGRELYIEFSDYDKSQVDEWINKNVISNLSKPETNTMNQYFWNISCKKREAVNYILRWLKPIVDTGKYIQFVSDVSHYDMVLLLDLLIPDGKTAIDIPDYISPCCLDINQELANYLNISLKEAFNINRDEFASEKCNFNYSAKKHNSLYDAKVIKCIYEKIKNIK